MESSMSQDVKAMCKGTIRVHLNQLCKTWRPAFIPHRALKPSVVDRLLELFKVDLDRTSENRRMMVAMGEAQWRDLLAGGLDVSQAIARGSHINAWPEVGLGPRTIQLLNGQHRADALARFVTKAPGCSMERDGFWLANVFLIEDLCARPNIATFLSMSV